MKDYFPEVAELDSRIFPLPERIIEWLGGKAVASPILIFRDTPDWHHGSFWAWDARHGRLRTLSEYDGGLRLAVAE